MDYTDLIARLHGLAEYIDDCDEAAAALEAQARRIAELEKENEILGKNTAIQMGQLLCENPDALSGNPGKWRFTIFDIQQLEARIAELEAALKPFAAKADKAEGPFEPPYPVDYPLWRAARAALNGEKE